MTREERERILASVAGALAEDRETIAEIIRQYGTSDNFVGGKARKKTRANSTRPARPSSNRCHVSG